jgi:hypothetical protein
LVAVVVVVQVIPALELLAELPLSMLVVLARFLLLAGLVVGLEVLNRQVMPEPLVTGLPTVGVAVSETLEAEELTQV